MGTSWNEDGEFALPANMTEDEVLEIVRELIGDDEMTKEELREAYRSGVFQELCPDVAQYAKSRLGPGDDVEGSAPKDDTPKVKIKEERPDTDGRNQPMSGIDKPKHSVKEEKPSPSHSAKEVHSSKHADHQSSSRSDKVKVRQVEISLTDSDVSRSSRHKKKKKKRSKDSKRKEKEKVREKVEKSKLRTRDSSSDSEDDRMQKERNKVKKETKKKKVFVMSSSSSSESIRTDERRIKTEKPTSNFVEESKKSKEDVSSERVTVKVEKDTSEYTPKPAVEPSETLNKVDVKEIKRERERTPEKKKEPKPFSKYNEAVSYTNLNRWKPVLHRDHFRYQRRFRLKPVSVVCVDLMDLPLVFYSPYRHPTNPSAVPLKAHLTVSSSRRDLIGRLEREKISTFRKKLNRKAAKIMKQYKYKKRSGYSSGEGNRKNKKNRIIDRIAGSASSSDISSIGVPRKRSKMNDDFKGSSRGKMSKAAREAEARRKKIEEVKRKADKLSARGTRKLPWENKAEYFTNSKKKDAKKERERLQAIEKKKKLEKIRKEKLTNAPSVKFQKILAQIDAANKAEASKPTVQLKIPKISNSRSRVGADYKVEGKIGIGEVASEVTRLLSSDVKVECPVMPESVEDFGEYTVKKIAWWLLKNEKDPPEFGVWHPELHDDDGMESSHEGDYDWPSDMSSVNGCVSDPEGLASEIPPDAQKVNDPDWADDYCGVASLYAKFRKKELMDKLYEKNPSQKRSYDSVEPFRTFMRVKPGTNYEKETFEAKCFVCAQEGANVKGRDPSKVCGQRQLGAHIRSESHKNNFRNFSLNLVTYEEKIEPPNPRKVYAAHLVEYSVNAVTNSQLEKPNLEENTKHHIGKIEPVRSDSPRPLIGGEASTGAIQVHEMPLPDEISLPSIEDYDISSDESLMQVKAAIRTKGKWHDALETNWRKWIDEETKIATQYNIEREHFINEPARHPKYQEEWLKFWDKRCLELEAEGLDTEQYDFQKDWMPFWLKRMQEILQEKYEGQVAMLKNKLGIDKHTLRSKFGISAEQTKRTKIKKKKKKVYDPGSSVKSSSKVVSGCNLPEHKQASTSKSNNRNSNDPKPTCLPTPPVTSDEGRNRERISSESLVSSRDSNLVPDKNHVGGKTRDLDGKSGSKLNSNFPSGKERKQPRATASVSSNSVSTEVPGEEKSSKPKPRAPPPPNITDLQPTTTSGKKKEDYRRRDNDRHSSQRQGSNRKYKHAHNSLDAPESEPKSKKRRENEDISNDEDDGALKLRAQLKDLKRALANEQSETSVNSDRPKVKPTPQRGIKQRERPTHRRASSPEDGEVGTSGSSVGDFNPGTQRVSTFVNKDIPGLSNFMDEKSNAPTPVDNLNKTSLGFHLLERKNSTDKVPSHSERSKHEHSRSENKHKNHHRQKDERHGKSHEFPHDKSKGKDHKKNKSKWDKRDDNRQKWSNKDRRNSSSQEFSNDKDYRASTDNRGNGPERRDSRDGSHNPRTYNYRNNNQPPSNSNQPSVSDPVGPPPMEESWEPESDVQQPQPITSLIRRQAPPEPEPEGSGQIPVVNPWEPNIPQQPWGTWGNAYAYPPHMTDGNNYYR